MQPILMMKLFLMLFISFLTTTAQALAKPGEFASVLLKDLEEQGIHYVGAFNIPVVLSEIENIQWHRSESPPPEEAARGRRSAYYNLEDKKVVLTDSTSIAKSRELLETHEALGALGYRDQNYALTTALNILRNVVDKDLQAKLVEAYGKSAFKKENLKLALGGSSVSGGGDEAALEIKNRLIEDILRSHVQVDISFFESYPEIDFEPMMDKSKQAVGVQYIFRRRDSAFLKETFDGVRSDSTFQEFFIIYFPAILWSQQSQQQAVIADIKKKILSIFPVTLEAPLVRETWRGICRHDIAVTFPRERDKAMDVILSVRTGLLTGCFSSEATTIRTPGL